MLKETVRGQKTTMEKVDEAQGELGEKVGVVAHRGNVDGVGALREVMQVVEGDMEMIIVIGIEDMDMQGTRMSIEMKMLWLCAKSILHQRVGIDPDHGMFAIIFYSFN
jgi:hypothetical protein